MQSVKQILTWTVVFIFFSAWFVENPSYLLVFSIMLGFGVIAVVGAMWGWLKLPEANRFVRYFLNTIWIGSFVFLFVSYQIFTNLRFEVLSIQDKLVFSGIISFISTLITFAFQEMFFGIARMILNSLSRK